MHVGCEFNGRWLSVGLLRVLGRLVGKEKGGVLNFIESNSECL
jgi:hypothetical protein